LRFQPTGRILYIQITKSKEKEMKKIVVLLVALIMVSGLVFADDEALNWWPCCPQQSTVWMGGCVPGILCFTIDGLRSDEEPADLDAFANHPNPRPDVYRWLPLFAPFTQPPEDYLVGNATIRCNLPAGYHITAEATHGDFTHWGMGLPAGMPAPTIPYTMKLGGQVFDPSPVATEIVNTDTNPGFSTLTMGQEKPLWVRYQRGFYYAGAYSDTVKFRIIAN
jgi:hypothetical protein